MNRQLCGVMTCLLKWTKIFRQLSNQSYIHLHAHFSFLFISKTLNLAGLLRYKDKHDDVWGIVVINSDPQYDWPKREFLLEFNIELTQNRKNNVTFRIKFKFKCKSTIWEEIFAYFESFLALKNRMMTLHFRSMEDEHL